MERNLLYLSGQVASEKNAQESPSKTSTSKDGTRIEDNENDVYRMLASVSFAVMLIIIGIPLWWKTTEVHRASLPYERISALNPEGIKIAMNITVYTKYPTRTNEVMRDLNHYFSTLNIYQIDLQPQKLDLDDVSVASIENSSEVHPSKAGQLMLVQVSDLPSTASFLISCHRIIYFTIETKTATLAKVIKDALLMEDELVGKVSSLVSPRVSTVGEVPRLRAALSYDLIFTVINSDPDQVSLVWDIKQSINNYMKLLLDQLSPVGTLRAKSQWLHLVDLGEKPTKSPFYTFTLNYTQLPHVITPLEKKLGSGVSKHPCIHLILYVPACDESPLSLLSDKGEKVAGMISPQWGALQILNPDPQHCGPNSTALVPSSVRVMNVFLTQLHTLLGANRPLPRDWTVANNAGPLLRSWELDSLYRIRAVEQLTSASLTLQSLAKLLGEISNIVINEEVAICVEEAVGAVEGAVAALAKSRLKEGLELSRLAYGQAETGFSNPSLLALLYFPDDQKYAVYIPLFLPIMIPVLMSLKNIYHWMSSTKPLHYKQD